METARLRLRRLRADDIENIRALDADAEVMKPTPARVPLPREQSEARLKGWIEKGPEREPLGIWVAERKDNGAFVGWFMLMPTRFAGPELGFMLVRAQWKQGFASEAAACILEYGFKYVDAIYAATDPDHAVSKKILKRLGFSCGEPLPFQDKILNREVILETFVLKREDY